MSRERKTIMWQSAIFAAVILLICMFFYRAIYRAELRKANQIATTIAKAGRLAVDSAAIRLSPGMKTEAEYQIVKSHLQSTRDLHPWARYVYIVGKANTQGVVSFWVDAEEDPEFASLPGEEYDTAQSPLMWQAFGGEVLTETSFTKDRWGTWLSSYAPIIDEQGQVVAVLGVDIDAAYIIERNIQYFVYTLILFLVSCTGGLSFMHLATYRLSKRIDGLANSLVEKDRTITQLANVAMLNGLGSIRLLHDTLEKCCSTETERCLALVDIDDLSRINEVYGFDAGDRVLQYVAHTLKLSVGEGGLVARTGANEFTALLAYPPEQIVTWYDSLRSALTEGVNQMGVPFFLSVGAACYPKDAATMSEWILSAEEALERAKRAGGNRMIMSGTTVNPLTNIPSFGALLGLVSAVDNKDKYTLIHSESVSAMAGLLARELGLPDGQCEQIEIAGLLHDVGKIAVPDSVLRKPGNLSEEERKLVQNHPLFGSRLIVDIPHSREIAEIVLYHHERWDGQGYPHRLKGSSIPLGARILAVVDSYSAMTTDRPYRVALTQAQAFAELKRGMGTQYDSEIVAAFMRVCRTSSAKNSEAITDLVANVDF